MLFCSHMRGRSDAAALGPVNAVPVDFGGFRLWDNGPLPKAWGA